jgi:hypothetical protein
MAVLLAIFCLAGCSETSSANNWREFKSEKAKFSAQFPGKVHVDDAGTIAQFEAAGQETNFRVTCSQVPLLKEKEAALRELRTMRDGAAKDMQATVEESRDADFQGHPGIEFTLAFAIDGVKMVSHSRYVRCQDRFYQVIVTAPGGTNAEQDVRKFLGSFEVNSK